MRIKFWPDKAWKYLMGEAWPWISPVTDDNYEDRIRSTLHSYWLERRLPRVPSQFLSEKTRDKIIEIRDQIGPTTVGGAGLEKIASVVQGNPDAFWFFDLGGGAWIVHLGNLHEFDELPGDAEQAQQEAEAIENAWRSSPGQALETANDIIGDNPYKHPTASLYKVPLELWQGRDPEAAMTALDRVLPQLDSPASRELGKTLSLTYGLLHALNENLEQAQRLQDETATELRPAGLQGVSSTEVRYHRARYLWALRERQQALDLLERVLLDDSSYLLRLSTDMAWRHGEEDEDKKPTIFTDTAELIDQARKEVTRWQQGRPQDHTAEAPPARAIDELLELGDDPYLILSVRSLVDDIRNWHRQQLGDSEELRSDLRNLREFAEQVPRDFPFRVGEGYAPRFLNGNNSDMGRIEVLVEQERWQEAADLIAGLEFDLPYSIKIALANYAERMVNALASSARVLASRGTKADYKRVRHLYQLAQQILGLRDPIRDLPGSVRPELGYQFNKVWEKLEEVRSGWITVIRRTFGKLEIQKPKQIQPVPRQGWRALRLRVIDASGEPVPGVPIIWNITEGPARAKNPSQFLTEEWALALRTGVARLPIVAKGQGDQARLKAWILGQPGQKTEVVFPLADVEGESEEQTEGGS